jgi:hypothetical protein
MVTLGSPRDKVLISSVIVVDLWVSGSRQRWQEGAGGCERAPVGRQWVTNGCHKLTIEAYASTLAPAIKDRSATDKHIAGEAITSPWWKKYSLNRWTLKQIEPCLSNLFKSPGQRSPANSLIQL